MIPATFDYEVASSVDAALSLLAQGGPDARLLAGGHSLIPMMKLRLARPSLLVDIGRIGDLSYIRDAGDHIAIGAGTRYHDVHTNRTLIDACPLVAHVAGRIGDPQVRHKGTIGGSVAHGDPASDLPPVLLALDAEFAIRGPGGAERVIAAADFFTGFLATALAPGEIVTEIRVPKLAASEGWSYLKFNRRAQDWAIVGVTAVVDHSNGDIARARVALTNMGPTPLRARATEAALAAGDAGTIAAASALAADGTAPVTDTNATADFRRHLAGVLVRRAIEQALAG